MAAPQHTRDHREGSARGIAGGIVMIPAASAMGSRSAAPIPRNDTQRMETMRTSPTFLHLFSQDRILSPS